MEAHGLLLNGPLKLLGRSYPVFTSERAAVGAKLPYHAILLLEQLRLPLSVHEGLNGDLQHGQWMLGRRRNLSTNLLSWLAQSWYRKPFCNLSSGIERFSQRQGSPA